MSEELPRFLHHERGGIRAEKLNRLAAKIEEIEADIESVEVSGVPDPGDLTIYYENGKA